MKIARAMSVRVMKRIHGLEFDGEIDEGEAW